MCCTATGGWAQPPQPGFADALLGRWDLTIESAGGPYPSWFEVRLRTETELMARFVGRVGSARYVSDIDFVGGRVTLRVPVQYESDIDALRFEGTLRGERIEGTTLAAGGAAVRFTATRAPALAAAQRPRWRSASPLFNGRDLAGWAPRSAQHAGCWRVQGEVLTATPPCVDLVTEATFGDFRLHAELRFPPGSNSGVYLRGRYEVQIQDDAGKAFDPLRMGGVYGFIAPSVDAALGAGEWQTLEVELVGRRVTVVLNGTTLIEAQEIPGITGGALDSDEGAPGPIMLQGDSNTVPLKNRQGPSGSPPSSARTAPGRASPCASSTACCGLMAARSGSGTGPDAVRRAFVFQSPGFVRGERAAERRAGPGRGCASPRREARAGRRQTGPRRARSIARAMLPASSPVASSSVLPWRGPW